MALPPHPMQGVYLDPEGVPRFRANRVVETMLALGRAGTRFDLNLLADLCKDAREDFEQFAQLIGYSVSGFGDLSYASPKAVENADGIASVLLEDV